MTRVLLVVGPIIGLAVIWVIVEMFDDRFGNGDDYDWQ